MVFICCGSHLSLPGMSLTYGSAIDLPETEGEDLAAMGKPLVPVDLVKMEFDGSEESSAELQKTYLEYRKLLQSNEKEK